MPVQQDTKVSASAVKVDDILIAVCCEAGDEVASGIKTVQHLPAAVTTVTTGSMYTALQTAAGRIRIRNTAQVEVGRMVKTEAEKEADELDSTRWLLDDFVKRMRRMAERNVMDEFIEKMSKYHNDVARGLAWYTEETMVAAHQVQAAAVFVKMLDHDIMKSLEGDDDAVGRVQVFKAWVKQQQRQLLQGARSPGGSTSAASNMSDLAQLKATAEMLDGSFGLSTMYLYDRLAKNDFAEV